MKSEEQRLVLTESIENMEIGMTELKMVLGKKEEEEERLVKLCETKNH